MTRLTSTAIRKQRNSFWLGGRIDTLLKITTEKSLKILSDGEKIKWKKKLVVHVVNACSSSSSWSKGTCVVWPLAQPAAQAGSVISPKTESRALVAFSSFQFKLLICFLLTNLLLGFRVTFLSLVQSIVQNITFCAGKKKLVRWQKRTPCDVTAWGRHPIKKARADYESSTLI